MSASAPVPRPEAYTFSDEEKERFPMALEDVDDLTHYMQAAGRMRERAEEAEQSLERTRAALAEAAALLETAEQDGHVTAGWLDDARTWRNCWQDVIVNG